MVIPIAIQKTTRLVGTNTWKKSPDASDCPSRARMFDRLVVVLWSTIRDLSG
jgi:hypothetical protein